MRQQPKPVPEAYAESLESSEQRRAFRRRVFRWFDKHQRELPWRKTDDPYCVWVSEIMLQQTQVVTVIPYFEKFLKRFPDVYALAAADEATVLRYWEGLGYYRRARQMHRAAQVVVEEHQGILPRQSQTLQALPGIGRYTAGAILSIAHDQREPILEANTIRLLARLIALDEPTTTAASQATLWDVAEELLPRKRVGAFNQGLMELGSLVCTPRNPECTDCPVARHCRTFGEGLQEAIPVPKKKTQYEAIDEAAVAIWHAGRVLVRQCGPAERWAGLWDFPRFPVTDVGGAKRRREVIRQTQDMTGVEVAQLRQLSVLKHAVTRYRISLTCYDAQATTGPAGGSSANQQWLTVQELENIPLSVTGRKMAGLLVGVDDKA